MDGDARSPSITLGTQALGHMMPLYLRLDPALRICGMGPTLQKLLGDSAIGREFEALFALKVPRRAESRAVLMRAQRLLMTMRQPPGTGFKGVAVPLTSDGGVLLNLSFGYAVQHAVRDHALSATDFAATDLAIELLYLHEAKVAVMGEVTKMADRLKGAKAKAEEQAITDALTGLGNRRAMERALARLLSSGEGFALLHLDLDFFKQVNDTMGHAAGDHVLAETAARLRACVRGGDLVVRVGGDEFVILLAGVQDLAPIRRVGGAILRRMGEGITYRGAPCRVALSIGAVLAQPGTSGDGVALLALADGALYASKKAGRARLSVAHPGGHFEELLVTDDCSGSPP